MNHAIDITLHDGTHRLFNTVAKLVKVLVSECGPDVQCDGTLLDIGVESCQIRQICIDGALEFFTKYPIFASATA